VPTDARIPWPAPIVIDVTPETASADRVIEVPAGVVVLEIRGSGWDSGEYDMLDLCEVFGVAADDSGDVAYSITNGCTWAESRFIDEGSEFAELIVADVRSAHQLTLSSTQSGLGPIALATLDPGDGPPLPTLLDGSPADSSAFPDPRVAAVDRSSGRTQLAGAGWSASIPIAFHACFTEADNTLPIDSCSLVATIDPTATGSFESAVPIPGADSRSPGDPAASYVVATQGDRLAVVGLRHREPELVDFSSIPEIPGVVDITIRGLRSGELASIERCEGNCRSLTQVIEVVGSGSGQDIVPVSLTAETREIQLVIDGEPISLLDTPPDFAIVEAAIPVEIPDDAPQATITVEPASVPGPGTYEFVVRGDGWLAAPPVFVLPCEAGATGVSAEEIGDTCDTSALTPATPEDQSFEVTVTYDVGPDGMTIAAGDAAQSQLATAGVTVE